MQLKLAALWLACAAFGTSNAMAQQRANTNPADPRAEAPPTRYESAFTGYQSFRDEKLAPWREVNDEVGRIGGQIGIFGGAHAGHGGGRSVENTLAPAATPQKPTPMHGPGHQGMKK